MPSSHLATGLYAVLALVVIAPAQHVPDAVRYGRDVRPILADRCFRCHGPDASTRAADLRLDVRDEAIRWRERGAAIVPFDPASSLLWQRVNAHGTDRMPPVDSGKSALDARELAILETWLLAGAEYEPHWAFLAPQPQPLPDAGDSPHPIDRFLTEALRERGLHASPPADAATQARRLFLVLTGLPPTPAELGDFVADARPDAYEQLVDRLLGEEPYRTRHAEHLAQMWLDAGRYADTSGIHMDAGRQAWAWRDWLIAALRDDLPFDRFVLEQLAGDLLPDATTAQRVATGFLRNHVTTDEGGAIDEEYRVEYAAERTATVGSVFLGLTLACARCHDHKFDPISQEDYFRLFSFFNSNQEPGLYSQVPDANRALEPNLPVPDAAQARMLGELRAQLATAERALAELDPDEQARFAAFRRELADTAKWTWQQPTLVAAASEHGATLSIEADGVVHATGANPADDVHVVTMTTSLRGARWLALTALPHVDQPRGRVGRSPNGNAVLQHVRLEARPAGDAAGEWVDVPLVHGLADVEQDNGDFVVTNVLDHDERGWAVGAHLAPPRPARALLLAGAPFAGDGTTELRVTLRYDSPYRQHTFARVRFAIGAAATDVLALLPTAASGFHVAGPFGGVDAADLYDARHGPEAVRTIDGAQRFGDVAWRFDDRLRADTVATSLPEGRNATYVARRVFSPTPRALRVALGSDDGFQLFANGALAAERRVDRGAALDQDEATVELPAGASVLVLKVVNTGGLGGFAWRHQPAEHELAGDLRLLVFPDVDGDAALLQRATTAFREQRSPHHRARRAEVQRLQQELAALDRTIPRAMVMAEAKEPRATFVLMRGEYDKPDPQRPVQRELPALFGALPADQPRDRLGLARWLVSERNPLLLRVQVNRLWEFVFGTGIVRSSEDFGLQGEWPSHPELLDWLATELRANGHSVRKLLRLLVTSAAFRQQSRVDPAAAAIDRESRLLAWFPRRRLTAESIRDQALFVGGLLVERTGGPSVKPYQPPGLWQEVAMTQSNTRVYEQGAGEQLWRRSLYTYWKRACPPPSLLALDAPTREFCTIRRGTTNTPLQALVLWNDEQFVEAARALAQRAATDEIDDDTRLVRMFVACTGHPLAGEPLARARATLHELRERYRGAPADADALLAIGQSPPLDGAPASELAALTVLANAFLNLDATLWID